MALASGTKLGPYEIQSLIGAGGMGEVYRAHDSRLDRTVAIKILPESFSADRERLQRFSQEARAAAALNHPNILSIFDIGEEQRVYLATVNTTTRSTSSFPWGRSFRMTPSGFCVTATFSPSNNISADVIFPAIGGRANRAELQFSTWT